VIAQDEARLARVDVLIQSRQEQTSRQVAGFLRGVQQACHAAAAQGIKLLEQKLSFWRTWKLLWSRQRPWSDFQAEVETRLKQTVQPEVEQVVRLLETDLRGLWPQLHDMVDQQLGSELRRQVPQTIPDFARQRRELLQSIQLALMERASGKSIEELLARMFHETSARLRLPAGVAAAGGIVALIAAMSSAAVADVTGIVAASAAAISALVAFGQRRKILRAYQQQMEAKCAELTKAIEQQLIHAIALFYKEVATAFQPLAAFCVTQRRLYEPLLKRAEALRQTFDALKARLG
jgi:hypothetical protein